LKRANELVKQKIHPTSIISGFRLASREAVNYIQNKLQIDVSTLGREYLVNVARTSLASKIVTTESDFFSNMVVDAILRVKTTGISGQARYPIKSVNILKAHGKSAKDTMFIPGFALNCTVASQAMPKKITNAKIALLDFNLNKQKLPMGAQVLVSDPKKMEEIKQREADIIKERIQLILKTGANVVLTTKGIDDLCLKYFVEAHAMGVRRAKKEDLKRIAKATGATIVTTLANTEGADEFDPSNLGTAAEVTQERIADDELIVMRGCKNTKTSSIILRGANSLMLEEMERSLHDALCIVKRTLESNAIVPGGGAVETALSIYLESFATTLSSREQIAIAEFAEALLVIPKTLAVNAAQDATELIAQLRADHHKAQTDQNKKDLRMSGLDLINGKIRNNLEAGVLEPAISKIKSIKFAVEAAITILRIDDLVKLEPKRPEQDQH
jgi:T-complex protein 1 subunit alpha